jgi:transposase
LLASAGGQRRYACSSFARAARIWAELHERAFRRLGGVTRFVVLDNLKEGVLLPDVYDPSVNRLYRDVLRHYGAVALPCRVWLDQIDRSLF